ncbi:MAG TPA: LytR C-terminal domain-containing protein [Nocardioides sp.]|nr:LytR C-terminal domain-containing protein [Nocardioides sp.]
MSRSQRRRDQRGVVFPSPVVMLSIIAIAMAGVAYVATRGAEPTEREVTTVSREVEPSASASPTPALPTAKPKPIKPAVKRARTYVEVYNNSGITGLAGRVAGRASDAGWQVVGSDNWYGTVPATTVYYPKRLKAEAKVLALDLGIRRLAPAVDPMRLDRLTIILTGDAG